MNDNVEVTASLHSYACCGCVFTFCWLQAIWRLVADALGRSPDDLRLIFAGAKVERDSPIKR